MIEGEELFSAPRLPPPAFSDPRMAENAAAFALDGPCAPSGGSSGRAEGGVVNLADYVITGADIWTMVSSQPIRNGVVVVESGVVSCVGSASQCGAASNRVPRSATFQTSGGQLWAGMISVSDGIGQYEMGEAPTHDGPLRGSPEDMLDVWAIEGMRSGGRHMWEAWRGGVLLSVTPPEGGAMIRGVSSAMWVSPHAVAEAVTGIDDTTLKKVVAVHIALGNSARSSAGLASSVSGQIFQLRKWLQVHTQSAVACGF